ncbi:MAG: autotransporter-associated beta strand repeat-containing protein, partial [Cyclobacteriaceae bacterium]|nr:autotransporter-associated beta strand repeat-containing protein [Cyclobacteriaceae bacterium]
MSLILRLLSRFRSLSAVEPVSNLGRHSIRFFLVLLILIVGTHAFAQKTWLPATGGDWSVGANWSGGTTPVAGDVVIIASDQSGNIVNVPTISLGGLTINGNALFGSTAAATVSVITVTGPLTIAAGKTLTLGVDGSGFRVNMILSSTSVSTIAGTLNVTSGTVNRFLQNDGDLTLTGTGLVRDNFSVTGFDSDFILGSGAVLRIGSSAGITTSPTATGNIQVTGVRTFPTTADYAYVGTANQVTGNGLPATVNDLIIANTGGGGNNTVTLTSAVGISNTLFVNSGIFALGFNNVNTVTAINMSGTSITGTGTLNLAGDVTINASASTAFISAPVALGTVNRTLTIVDGAANPDLTISSVVSGTGSLTKNGTGTLTLSASNTFTGGLTLNAGTINANNANCFGTNAGTLTINGGALSNTTGGAITLTNYAQTWNGDFSYFGTQNLDMGTGTITLTGNRNVAVLSSTLGLSGVVAGAFGINKSGGGVLVLGGNNTFTGGLGIDAGRVTLANVGALNSTSPNVVAFGVGSTGSLRLNGLSVSVAGLSSNGGTPIIENAGAAPATLTVNTVAANNFGGVIQNLGPALSLSKSGSGTLALSGNNTYTGGTNLSAGTLAINSATAIGTGTLTINGGTLDNTSAGAITLSTNNPQSWNGNFSFTGTQNLNLGTGAVTPNANRQVTVNAGELTVGGVIGGGAIGITKLGAGTLTLTAANTFSSGFTLNAGQLNINNANALGSIAGTFSINGGAIGNTSVGAITTVNYPMSWGGDFAFNGTQNLNLGSGTITLTGNRLVTVNSNTLTAGGFINAPALSLTKAGVGTLSLGANDVTINGLTVSNGTFISTSSTLFITGSFANSGTFNNNSGTVHFNGGTPQLVAAVTYNHLITSGAGQKNAAGSITVNSNLTNSTILDMGANSLSVGGVIDNTGGNLRFTGAVNGIAVNTGTVTYYGSSQTIAAGVYNNLVINQAAGQALLGGATTINGTLTLTNGNLNLNGFDLTLGPTATISVASPSATRMIIANGSQVIKNFTGVGSFVFPIGDNTGATEYSPITINITSGSGFPANVGVSVVDAKHPNNSSSANFLSRYWEVDQTGITSCIATITATYPVADISGTEANINTAQLPGTFNQATNPWIKYSPLAANTLTATGATLIAGTNTFTGIRGADPVATITGGGVTICAGGTVSLNTTTTGDAPFTFSWSPATGLSATNIANPIASPLSTETYTVTIRDANGIVDTDITTITVNAVPNTPVVTPAGPVTVCEGSAAIVLTSDAASGNQWYRNGIALVGETATTLNITTSPANSGSYTVISTVSGCASAVSNTVAVTINALPFSTPGVSPVNATICSGSNVTVTITGTEPGINYRLFDGVTPVSTYVAGTGAAINLVSSTLTANTTLTVEAQNPVTGCSIFLPGTTTVTVGATIPTPVISPVSPVTACVGDPSVVLTSSAVSGNQWYKDGIPIPGEVNQTLSISTAVVNSGSYTVYEIQAGCTSAASVPVNVTINSIASPPVASNPNPICVGQAIPTLTAAGSNLNWYSDAALTTLVGTGSPFTPSATEVDNLTAGSYLLYVTQTIGCESPATTVTVVVNPAVVAHAGVDTSLCDGQTITLGGSPSATGGSGSYTYSWTSVPPGFTSTQSNPLVTPTIGITTYVLQVTDAFGCTDSDQIDITVNEVPVFTVTNNTSAGTGQICSGSTINIDLATPAVGATITLQPVTYGAFITGGLYAAGGTFADGSTITEGGGLINTSNAPVSIIYTFSVATPNCTNPVTQQATVVVNPSPVLSITNSSPSICSGSAVNVLLNSVTSGAVIQITSVNYGSVTGGTLSAGSTFTPGSSITESLTNPGNNPVTVRYNLEVVANGCTTSGFFTDVVINPNPTFVATNFAPQICHGDQTSIFFGSVTAGHQINVVNVFYGAVTGGTVNPGFTTFTSATPLQEALFNNTNAPIDVEYTFNVTTPATTPVCPIAPVNQVVTVRVYPNPNFSVTNNSGGGTGTICSGQQSSILLNTPILGGQVRLVNVTYGAVIGSYSAGALFTNGQTLSEILTNNTGAPITVDYEFEAIVSSCAPSASQVVSVTVNPTPNVVALPASQTICSGSNTSIALSTTNGVAGATYSWTVVQ